MSEVLTESVDSVEVSGEGSVSETAAEVKADAPVATPKKRGRPKSTTPKAPKATKTPRVKKSEADRRSSAVAGALTASEHEEVSLRAAAANLTVSNFVRLAVLAYQHPAGLGVDRRS